MLLHGCSVAVLLPACPVESCCFSCPSLCWVFLFHLSSMEYLLNDYFPILPLWQIIVTNQDIKSVNRCIHIRYSMALLSKWHENTQQNIQFCYNKHTFCIYFKNPHQNTCHFIYSTSIYVDGSLRCIWYKAIIHLKTSLQINSVLRMWLTMMLINYSFSVFLF